MIQCHFNILTYLCIKGVLSLCKDFFFFFDEVPCSSGWPRTNCHASVFQVLGWQAWAAISGVMWAICMDLIVLEFLTLNRQETSADTEVGLHSLAIFSVFLTSPLHIWLKVNQLDWVVVMMNTINTNTWEAKAGESVHSKPAWYLFVCVCVCTYIYIHTEFQASQGYI